MIYQKVDNIVYCYFNKVAACWFLFQRALEQTNNFCIVEPGKRAIQLNDIFHFKFEFKKNYS